MKHNIKDMVKNGKKATFIKYNNGQLIYGTECGFEFPVPIASVAESNVNVLSKEAISFTKGFKAVLCKTVNGFVFTIPVADFGNVDPSVLSDENAHFIKYRNGKLIYKTTSGFEFSMSIINENEKAEENIDVFAEEKAITLMRYINKHIKAIEKDLAEVA
jgi:hypothetical protein